MTASAKRNILFVCTGNTCRSPMAEAYFKHLTVLHGLSDIHAASAGVAAFDGEKASPQALFALSLHGIDGTRHRSQAVTETLVSQADFIYAMTHSHKQKLVNAFPPSAERVCTLLSLLESDADLPDPFGGSSEEYVRCLNRMIPALEKLVGRLQSQQYSL